MEDYIDLIIDCLFVGYNFDIEGIIMNDILIKNDNLVIEKLDTVPTTLKDNEEYTRISSSALASGVLDMIASNELAELSSKAYVIKYPKGISGVPVYSDEGMLLTLRNPETGRFTGTGALQPLEKVAAMAQVFSVLAIATNQYYLNSINTELVSIKSGISDIMSFLTHEKAAELYGEAKSVFSIYENYASIIKNKELSTASLATIQRVRAFAESNIQFYFMEMKSLFDKANNAEKLNSRFHEQKNCYEQAINLFGLCTILEIIVSRNYDEQYLTYYSNELKSHVEDHLKLLSQFKGVIDAHLNRELGAKLKNKNKIETYQTIKEELNSMVENTSSIKQFEISLEKLIDEYTNPMEYTVLPNGEIYQRLVA